MKKAVIYIHGKGGNISEAEFYKHIFSDYEVIGFDYVSSTPWQAKEEFSYFFKKQSKIYESLIIVANSIGAYFTMLSDLPEKVKTAFFISPVTDMEYLINKMMAYEGVTEKELKIRKEITTGFGETLSFEYLTFVRNNPVKWKVKTCVFYGENDNLIGIEVIKDFVNKTDSVLRVMKNGEHYFHTQEQMEFIEKGIKEYNGD